MGRFSDTNLKLQTLMFDTNVIIRAKVEKCEPTLLFIPCITEDHVIGGQRVVIAPPFLLPYHCGPASWLKYSSKE